MDAFESLSLCAEIAIAITGFSGVVLVFSDHAGGPRPPLDRVLFRTLFTASLIPLGLVAIATVFEAAGVQHATIWRLCSATHAVAVSATAILNARSAAAARSREPEAQIQRSMFVVRGGVVVLVVAFLVLCLQLANVFSLHTFWPVLVAVWWGLAVSLFSFVSLLFFTRAA